MSDTCRPSKYSVKIKEQFYSLRKDQEGYNTEQRANLDIVEGENIHCIPHPPFREAGGISLKKVL